MKIGTSKEEENRRKEEKIEFSFEICDDIIVDVAVFQQPGLNS